MHLLQARAPTQQSLAHVSGHLAHTMHAENACRDCAPKHGNHCKACADAGPYAVQTTASNNNRACATAMMFQLRGVLCARCKAQQHCIWLVVQGQHKHLLVLALPLPAAKHAAPHTSENERPDKESSTLCHWQCPFCCTSIDPQQNLQQHCDHLHGMQHCLQPLRNAARLCAVLAGTTNFTCDGHWRKMPHTSTPGPQTLLYNGYITKRAEAKKKPPHCRIAHFSSVRFAQGSGLLTSAVCYAMPKGRPAGLD
jgi:hypothetical protein